MQRVTPVIRDAFGPVEEALQETFLLTLFQGLGEGPPGPVPPVSLARG